MKTASFLFLVCVSVLVSFSAARVALPACSNVCKDSQYMRRQTSPGGDTQDCYFRKTTNPTGSVPTCFALVGSPKEDPPGGVCQLDYGEDLELYVATGCQDPCSTFGLPRELTNCTTLTGTATGKEIRWKFCQSGSGG